MLKTLTGETLSRHLSPKWYACIARRSKLLTRTRQEQWWRPFMWDHLTNSRSPQARDLRVGLAQKVELVYVLPYYRQTFRSRPQYNRDFHCQRIPDGVTCGFHLSLGCYGDNRRSTDRRQRLHKDAMCQSCLVLHPSFPLLFQFRCHRAV